MTELERRIRLEILITEREGMIAENIYREHSGESQPFTGESFLHVLKGMKELLPHNNGAKES